MTTVKKKKKKAEGTRKTYMRSDYILVLLKIPRLFDFRSSFSNRFYQYDSHNTMLYVTTIPNN